MANTQKINDLKSKIAKLKKGLGSKASASLKAKANAQIAKYESEIKGLQGTKTTKKTTGKTTTVSKAKALSAKIRGSQGLSKSKSDIEKDANRPALKAGKRISKYGNKYYEYRENRIDRRPQKYARLEDGGEVKTLKIPQTEKEKREVYKLAFGKEFDSQDRKQNALPIDIATIVAMRKLETDKGYKFYAHGGETNQEYVVYGVTKVDNEVKVIKEVKSHKLADNFLQRFIDKGLDDEFEKMGFMPKAKFEKEKAFLKYADGGITNDELDKVRQQVDNFLNPLGYSARVEKSIGDVLYIIEPSTRKVGNNRKDFFDGMQILAMGNGTFEVSEYQAGKNEDELHIYKESKSLTLALKDLVKGNKRKPIKKYADGGMVKWQDVQVGDSANVKSENKTGVIVHTYGRKFHLKFVDGSEKTYDASELEFFKDDEDEFARGGYNTGRAWTLDHYQHNKSEDYEKPVGDSKYADGGMTDIGGTKFSTTDLSGMFAKGGSIKNQYKGRSAEDIWDSWTISQRVHFLKDHYLPNLEKTSNRKEYEHALNSLSEVSLMNWNKLPSSVHSEVERHIFMGQYANGGELHRSQERMYAKGGLMEHGLMIGDMIVSKGEIFPTVILVKNDGDYYGVDLYTGERFNVKDKN